MTPTASVLLPFKDVELWIEEAAASIEHQSWRDFEVLAVDDGSSDGSRKIIEGWADRDRRVRLLETTDRSGRGIVAALELARAHARGDVLLRMDGDDVSPLTRFEAQISLLSDRPGLAGCGTRVEKIPRDRLTEGGRAYERWLNSLLQPEQLLRDLFIECPIAHPTLAVRAGVLEAAGGYHDGPFPEDYDLLLRLLGSGAQFAQASCPPLQWRDRSGRLQRADARYSLDAFRRTKVRHLLRGPLSDGPTVVMWGAGPTGKAFSRLLAEAGHPIGAFVDVDPRKIGQDIHGAPVIAPPDLGEPAGRVALGAVAGEGPRGEVRSALERLGWTELSDFWIIA